MLLQNKTASNGGEVLIYQEQLVVFQTSQLLLLQISQGGSGNKQKVN